MKRILVPLDGTELAASILPDASRLAGPDGEIILVRDVTINAAINRDELVPESTSVQKAKDYLETIAQTLRASGMTVRTEPVLIGDPAIAIDLESQSLHADMVAMATHGRSPIERVRRGSIAWRVLLRSLVPVMLRHVESGSIPDEPAQRRIMVPLDGSERAETAVSLAVELAKEWHARLDLVQVVPDPLLTEELAVEGVADLQAAREYLQGIIDRVSGDVEAHVVTGRVGDTLVGAVDRWSITDVVMTTHGRTGVSRMIMGSIADALIHRLTCPIIIIPSLVALDADLASGTQHDRSVT